MSSPICTGSASPGAATDKRVRNQARHLAAESHRSEIVHRHRLHRSAPAPPPERPSAPPWPRPRANRPGPARAGDSVVEPPEHIPRERFARGHHQPHHQPDLQRVHHCAEVRPARDIPSADCPPASESPTARTSARASPASNRNTIRAPHPRRAQRQRRAMIVHHQKHAAQNQRKSQQPAAARPCDAESVPRHSPAAGNADRADRSPDSVTVNVPLSPSASGQSKVKVQSLRCG